MDGPAPASFSQLASAPGWRTLDFISDLHLQGPGATFDTWRRYLMDTPADAVFILGDLFEAWVGDDAADAPGFAGDCARVLREAAQRRPLFFMQGNRDFLAGERLAHGCGFTLLSDPTVLQFAGRRWLLSHGDLLCLADTAYLRFRTQVRSHEWQAQFLAKPLPQREEVARQMRGASQDHQRVLPAYADVDAAATREWLRAASADTLIHGHTHHPAEHDLGDGLRRIVLSDWDMEASSPRAEVLRLVEDGSIARISLA